MKEYFPLIQKPNWIEAFALLVLLCDGDVPYGTKITKKLCGELLHSPTKWKRAAETLEFYWIIKVWSASINPWDFTREVEEKKQNGDYLKIASAISKLLPSHFNVLVNLLEYTNGQLILEKAEEYRYPVETFLDLFIKEVKKDKFWGWVLTGEMVIRKFAILFPKFSSRIPKATWNFDTISSIF